MSDSTIQEDVQDTDDTGIDAFLSSFADDPKKKGPPAGDEGAPDTQEPETPAEPETKEGEPEEGSEADPDPDDQEVEIKVGEETKKATLRDLKRLYGQEAALTQKSQKASEQLRVAEAEITRATESSKALLERAQARYKPYAELDWLVVSQQMRPEDFAQLRRDAAEVKADVDFLTVDLEGHMRAQQDKQAQAYQQAAGECIKVLTDPTTGIEGFGKPLYDEMVGFAEEQGLPQVRTVTNPATLRLLHMAMQWAKHQAAAKAAAAKVKKAVDQPTRVMKPGNTGKSDGNKAALDKLSKSGDLDDAAAAFMASF